MVGVDDVDGGGRPGRRVGASAASPWMFEGLDLGGGGWAADRRVMSVAGKVGGDHTNHHRSSLSLAMRRRLTRYHPHRSIMDGIGRASTITNGILLSSTAFNSLSVSAQQEVLASIGLGGIEIGSVDATDASAAPSPASPPVSDGGEGPVELTVAMVRKLADKLGDKTLTALKVIARSDSPQFHMKDVIDATEGAKNYMDVRGVWSALTRRTRNIMNDSTVDLIWWIGDSILDDDDNYVDHLGAVSPLTYHSLRTHFGY
jgi:hypothetical protein